MEQIAIYGKGGIGKSTVSANISYQLSKQGIKVAQIGCDPKHDSTRLLLNGKTQTTVLDHINSGSQDIGDTVSVGKNGILCIETGGPEPGVGCAGRGILTAFNFLENNSVVDHDTDVIIYDVLGDVVCGGFAVPLRRKYADAVFIVTSGEFMSLYAANNVLKGIRNFDNDKCRVAGLILNMRGNEGEFEYVKNFADAVGLPIVTRIPRSRRFYEAESEGVTVSEKFPDTEESNAIGEIVSIITELRNGGGKLYPAHPLNDDDLDLVAKGKPVTRSIPLVSIQRELAVSERNVLKGCGSYIACSCCMGIRDADVIIHGPKSCHYFFSSGWDGYTVHLKKTGYLRNVSQRLFCTDLDDHSSIFGGVKELRELIESRIIAGTKVVFVVTTCVPGIIGDDVQGACAKVQEAHPGSLVVPIEADGILYGGSHQAREIAMKRLCTLFDYSLKPVSNEVNIIGYGDTTDKVMMRADEMYVLLEGLGMHVNCRFLDDNSFIEFRQMKKGSINLMAALSVNNRQICQILEKEAGIPWYSKPLPAGMAETEAWINDFGSMVGAPEEKRNELLAHFRREFEDFKNEYSGRFDGLKAVIYCPTATNLNWLFEVLDVLGAEVTNIFCPTNSKWNHNDEVFFADKAVEIEGDVDFDRLQERLRAIKPDMVLGSNQMLSQLKMPHYSFSRPRVGVKPTIECAKRIVRMMEVSRL